MATRIIQNAFNGGELSPRLLGRTDIKQYKTSVKTMENMYPLYHGGAKKRPGTQYIGTISNSAQTSKFIPFIYSRNSSYILILNDNKIEFINNGAFILSGGSTHYSITSNEAEDDLPNQRFTQKGNQLIITDPDGPPSLLTRTTDTNWSIAPIVFDYQALNDEWYYSNYLTFKLYTPGNGTDYFSSATPDKYKIVTNGSGGITSQTWITGPHANCGITGVVINGLTDAATTWFLTCSFSTLDRQEFDVYSALTITTVADTAGSLNNKYFYMSSPITDYYVWYNVNSAGTDPAIVGKTGIQVAVATGATANTVASTTNTSINSLSAFSSTVSANVVTIHTTLSHKEKTAPSAQTSGFTLFGHIISPVAEWSSNNYPNSVAFHEQRLFFGGSASYPQHVWGSQIGNYTIMTVGPRDDDAVNFSFDTNTYDEIYRLMSGRNLQVFSFSGEETVEGSSQIGTITAGAIMRIHTNYGIKSSVAPLRLGPEILFVDRTGHRLRAIYYDIQVDQNQAEDLTVISEHITGTAAGIVDMTYQQDPDSVIWAPRDDGVLLACTHQKTNGVNAWSRCITATAAGDSIIENVVTIPNGDTDDTYLLVKRVINGNTIRYIEKLNYDIQTDCSVIYDSTPTTTITGLSHLEGETVKVQADGKTHNDCIVTSGNITLDYSANVVYVGLGYTATIDMLHPDVETQSGTSQGAHLSIKKIVPKFQDTVGIKWAVKDGDGVVLKSGEVPVLNTNSLMDTAPIPFTGDKVINMNAGWSPPFILSLYNDYPQPFTVLSVVEFIDVEK